VASASHRHPRRGEPQPEIALYVLLAAAVLAISPFAFVLAAPLMLVRQRYPLEFLVGTLVATGAAVLLARPALAHMQAGLAEFKRLNVFEDPGRAFGAAAPGVVRAWLLMLTTAPAMALCFDLGRRKTVEEQAATQRRRAERSRERRARSARKRALGSEPTIGRPEEEVIALGYKADGERVGFEGRRGLVGLVADWLLQHMLVAGASGSGKSVTLFRIAFEAARRGIRVYYFDAKADRRAMERFRSLMKLATGSEPAVFRHHGFDGFRGDAHAVFNRLIQLVRYSEEGDGAYYRDVAKRLLWAVCSAPEGPPRSSTELLARLKPAELRRLAPDAVQDLGQREVAGVRLRYEAFFAALGGSVDGGFGFEDVRAAYLMLDGLSLKEEAGSLARFLLEDFGHFAAQRKHPGERALLILDEFSAIAESADAVNLVERLRSYGVGVVLAPQAEAGMGDEQTAERIVQNMDTVILHATKRPESLAALAGTRIEVQSSLQHDHGRATGVGSGRSQHVFKVDPNDVRQLRPGECFVIRGGRAARVQIAPAPSGPELPPLVKRPHPRPEPKADTQPPSDDLRL